MQDAKAKRAFTMSEAAEYACVGYSTVRNWITSGILPFEQLPSRGKSGKRFILIRRVDLDTFLNEQRVESD